MDRRDLLMSGAGAGLLFAIGGAARAQGEASATAEEARLARVFDEMMTETLDRSPETVTMLGLDHGDRAAAKFKLDDRSLDAWRGDIARNTAQLARLRTVTPARLKGLSRSNYASVLYTTALQEEINARFPIVGSPYAVSQLTGAYQSVPDFLDSQHSIENRSDAEAYVARLNAFGTAVDQDGACLRHDVEHKIVPPDFIISRTLSQLRTLRDTPPDRSNLVLSLVKRTKEKGVDGAWEAKARKAVAEVVAPALDRQIAALEALRPTAGSIAGVSRIPDGEAFYAASLRSYTTSDLPPSEIHKIGLDLVARQSAEIDQILKAQGMSSGTVGQRLRALYEDPKYRYPNTDAGREKLLADLNAKVRELQAKLPQWFGTLPKAKLDIRRVPVATQAGAPGGYYEPGALDGSRPGAYYINLRDTAEVPTWTLPTLTFHEGIPGHHLQLSLAQEAPLPTIRKIQGFSGYQEGWALYAEELAVEMGMYENDPLGHVGQLHDSVFRAVRLVVDSGIHAQGWSREQAIRYYTETLGDPEASATTEVERYCVWPGQACSYMLGKLTWLDQRARAKAALGGRFDIRKFHDAGLLAGAVPLTVLEDLVGDYVAAASS